MKSSMLGIGLVTLAFFICSKTVAQTQAKGPDSSEFFSRLDANEDGYIVWDEFNKARDMVSGSEEEKKKRFEGMDANDDGKVDLDEFKASIEKRMRAKRSE